MPLCSYIVNTPPAAPGVGDLRTRVALAIRSFQGSIPVEIVQRCAILALAELQAVIAYYLSPCFQIEEYPVHRERLAEEVRQRMESRQEAEGTWCAPIAQR